MVEPVNGQNPLVQHANSIRLPMPGEEFDEDDEDYDEDGEEYGDVDDAPVSQRDPLSEDEQFNGVNLPPPDPDKPRRKRRRPPMPSVPTPPEGKVFVPPFDVLPDGTVTGPKVGDASDELPPGFDPPRGSAEAMVQMVYAKPPQRMGGN
jgi:hypothetical protein